LGKEKDKPFLADGSLVGDYTLLFKYWEIARSKDLSIAEKAILSHKDFSELERIVNIYRGRSIVELINYFKNNMKNRIDPEIAVEAYKRTYGIEVEESIAVDKLATILASWLMEAARQLKIISYHSWRNTERKYLQ